MKHQAGTLCLLVISQLSLLTQHGIAQSVGAWRYGTTTYYGTDAWSIHQGSCGYGYIYKDEPLGWDVVAITDFDKDYITSCGTCYEVACNNGFIKDGYGVTFDRNKVCYDPTASIVVRITDTCPCIYPPNAYSNKRWCCQSDSVPHVDMSLWAYEKLAAQRWGVIGIKFRTVPCWYKPAKLALAPQNATFSPPPPSDAFRKVRDWPEFWSNGVTPRRLLADGSTGAGWVDASYNAQISSPGWAVGIRGQASYCATIHPKGAVSIFASSGSGGLSNGISLSFWVYVGENNENHVVPDVTIVAGGPKGDCYPIQLQSIVPRGFAPTCQYCITQWWRYVVPLSALAGQGLNSIINNNKFFLGCGGNTAAQVNYIDLRNYNRDDVAVCVAEILLK